MTKQPKPAARRGSENRQKSHPVTSRYSPEEYAQLDEAASRAGLTRASFQRVQSLETPPKTRSTRRAPIERELLAKLLGQVGKVGGNLNQLTRAANIAALEAAGGEGELGPSLAVEIRRELVGLHELRSVIMMALGFKP